MLVKLAAYNNSTVGVLLASKASILWSSVCGDMRPYIQVVGIKWEIVAS